MARLTLRTFGSWCGLAILAGLAACSGDSGGPSATGSGGSTSSGGQAGDMTSSGGSSGTSASGGSSGSGGGSGGTSNTGGSSGGGGPDGTGGSSGAGASGSSGSSGSGGSGGQVGGSDAGSTSGGTKEGGTSDATTGGGGGSSAMDPGSEGDGDLTIGPNFSNAPAYSARVTSKGQVKEFTMNSSDSKIYPTDVKSKMAFTRKAEVYIPAGYVQNTEVPFIVLQDGYQYAGDLIPALDSLISDKKIPSMAAVLVNPGPGDGGGSERGLEYDTVSDVYVNWVETELLPKVATDYKLKFTKDPEGRAMMGGSSGGAAAFTAGWFRPDLYRRILTYSGTFVNQASSSMYPHGAWSYAESLIAGTDKKPLRVFLECGSNDNGSTSSATGMHNWVAGNKNMAAALKAKGYHYRFVYANGASHVDDRAIKQSLPDALVWLWRGYVPPAN